MGTSKAYAILYFTIVFWLFYNNCSFCIGFQVLHLTRLLHCKQIHYSGTNIYISNNVQIRSYYPCKKYYLTNTRSYISVFGIPSISIVLKSWTRFSNKNANSDFDFHFSATLVLCLYPGMWKWARCGKFSQWCWWHLQQRGSPFQKTCVSYEWQMHLVSAL